MISSRNVLNVTHAPVGDCDPPAAWIGGKRHLAKRICAALAATPHTAYCEPFIGMGGVFLRRRVRPPVEVINDISGEVVTLFRVLQRFPDVLLRELRWRPAMRAEFDRLKETADRDLLDIERAARFLYLQTLAFGGKVTGQSYGVSATGPQNFDLRRLETRIERLHDRLAGVVIENLDWLDFLARYDRPGTLFYLDPPYWGSEGDYGAGLFIRGDFQRMADRLRAGQGMFLLSINDRPEVREMFAWADIEAVKTTYSIAGGVHVDTNVGELLIGRGVNLAPAAAQERLL
ncbi:DNA adenine methylase [Brevundimonas subvibrioides]|uniref:site-specific DNA-methyltransferase (adenine-specific) n=1 Tax=Brevundimonas subvibrioides (strain ATCC 15264 / DSM 4735 / LMG 14903 / NBRC 16000 / CB 81) TaxID=633149 RepID=D9QGA4_BRESC|nr:DNA adenine methylase [Brevundimonas subvibrioides]ADL00720.1 D12 class N6 adenine-specific DNA methyltransferase [Brevundimonas subvibrioides ATCC 15264]